MADIELVRGEFGDTYVITIQNPDGTAADISLFTSIRLIIKDKNQETTLLDKTTGLTISSPDVNWLMASGEQDFEGDGVAQIILSRTGVTRKTKLMTVKAFKKLD